MGRLITVLRALLVPLGPGARALVLRLVERFGWKWVAGGAAVLLYAAVRYRTWIPWILAVLAVAAWMHAPDRETEAVGGDPEQAGEQLPDHPIPGLLWDLIDGAPGVHLKTLTERLQAAAPGMALNRAVVREELAALGIPVRPSVRDAAGRVNEGVHRDDLRVWEEGPSSTPSVPLSKTRSNPVATVLTSDVANPATGVATPPTPAE
ncbi:hypothetical protein ACWC3Y_10920 [Streptomyces sp. NPDC001296]